MDSVLFNYFTCCIKGRRRRNLRYVRLMLNYRLSTICFILAIIKYNSFTMYSVHVALTCTATISYPNCHLHPGKNKVNNIRFTKKLISSLIICNLLLFLLLLMSEDIHPTPVSVSFTEFVSSSNLNSFVSIGNTAFKYSKYIIQTRHIRSRNAKL